MALFGRLVKAAKGVTRRLVAGARKGKRAAKLRKAGFGRLGKVPPESSNVKYPIQLTPGLGMTLRFKRRPKVRPLRRMSSGPFGNALRTHYGYRIPGGGGLTGLNKARVAREIRQGMARRAARGK